MTSTREVWTQRETYVKYNMPSRRISDANDSRTRNALAVRIVLQVLIQVTTITIASEVIMQDRVATETVYSHQ